MSGRGPCHNRVFQICHCNWPSVLFTPPLLCSLGTPIALLSPRKGTHTTRAHHADLWVTHAQSCSAHSQAQRCLVGQLSHHLKVLCPAAACTRRDDSITSFSDNSPSTEPSLPLPCSCTCFPPLPAASRRSKCSSRVRAAQMTPTELSERHVKSSFSTTQNSHRPST